MSWQLPGDHLVEFVIAFGAIEVQEDLHENHTALAPRRGWNITTCEKALRDLLNGESNYFLDYEGIRRLIGDAVALVAAEAKKGD